MTRLALAFFGSAPFSVATLAALFDAGHEVRAVYTQPPRAFGRGHQVTRSPLHVLAEERGVPVHTPTSLKDDGEQRRFAALALDAAVVAAYGLILPRAILSSPRLGCFNVHASLLPRWRGAAPIQRAILAGDAETGVTIMAMEAGLDTGPMLLSQAVPITAETTAPVLQATLAQLGARMMLEALEGVAAGSLQPRPQSEAGVTYAAKVDRDEGRVDWQQPAVATERMVRAFDPWPAVWFSFRGERIRVRAASVVGVEGPPGTVLDNQATVACGSQALRLLALQRPGRAALETAAFQRGFPLPAGSSLG
ncbi:MAG: methionyl-tRNA formyltransferase [Defluviicoccus sp.]